jgi:hypothetical protein
VNVTDFQHITGDDMTSSASRGTAKVYIYTLFLACPYAARNTDVENEDNDGRALRFPPSFPMIKTATPKT